MTCDENGGLYPSDRSFLYSTKQNIETLKVNRLAKYIRGSTSENNALTPCSSTLVSLSFEDDPLLEVIQPFSFYNCVKLTTIDLSSCTHLTTIAQSAFSKCIACSSIILPNGLKTLGDSCFTFSIIESFVFPSSVTNFPFSLFDECKQLSSLTIPDNSDITTINRWCIAQTKITTIKITEKVTSIDTSSFEFSSLESITVDSKNDVFTIQNGLLINVNTKYVISCPQRMNVETIDIPEGIVGIGYVSMGRGIYNYVNIPSSLTNLEANCFMASKLIELTIPDTVAYIGSQVFWACKSLRTVNLPSSLTSLSNSMFLESSISEITIPDTVTSIGTSCFVGCYNLRKITLPESVQSLEGRICERTTQLEFVGKSKWYILDNMFIIDKNNLTISQYFESDIEADISILSSVEEISYGAFQGYTKLRSITFPQDSALRRINNNCFTNCWNLRFINLPKTIEFVGYQAFCNCYELVSFRSYTLNEGGSEMFKDCKKLSSIDISSCPLKTFAESSFFGCISLNSIDLPNNLVTINQQCFAGCNKLASVSFPSTVESIGPKCFYQCSLRALNLYECDSLVNIPDYAFSQNNLLSNVILPPHLETIGLESFSSTGMTNLTIASSLISFGDNAFKNCQSLTNFDIPSDSQLVSVGIGAFRGCISLTNITGSSSNFRVFNGALFDSILSNLIVFPPSSSIKYFSFPDSAHTINDFAFQDCRKIISIMIPSNSVETISSYAFDGCISLQWINIPSCVKSVGENAFRNCPILGCGLQIENRNKDFLSMLISKGRLRHSCVYPCKNNVTCNTIKYQPNIYACLFVFLFI